MANNEGNLEAVTSAIGEALSEVHGLRFSRLRTALVEGGTVG